MAVVEENAHRLPMVVFLPHPLHRGSLFLHLHRQWRWRACALRRITPALSVAGFIVSNRSAPQPLWLCPLLLGPGRRRLLISSTKWTELYPVGRITSRRVLKEGPAGWVGWAWAQIRKKKKRWLCFLMSKWHSMFFVIFFAVFQYVMSPFRHLCCFQSPNLYERLILQFLFRELEDCFKRPNRETSRAVQSFYGSRSCWSSEGDTNDVLPEYIKESFGYFWPQHDENVLVTASIHFRCAICVSYQSRLAPGTRICNYIISWGSVSHKEQG